MGTYLSRQRVALSEREQGILPLESGIERESDDGVEKMTKNRMGNCLARDGMSRILVISFWTRFETCSLLFLYS